MTRASHFEAAIRHGRRAARPLLVAHLGRAAGGADPPRVGLVVSRAIGSAVARNRVSRRLRHVARARIEVLPAGSLLVLRATPAAARATSRALAADLDSALRRLLPGVGDAAIPARVGTSGRRSSRGVGG